MTSFTAFLAFAAGHGGLTFPPPRNNHQNIDPRNTSHANGNYQSCQGGPCRYRGEK